MRLIAAFIVGFLATSWLLRFVPGQWLLPALLPSAVLIAVITTVLGNGPRAFLGLFQRRPVNQR